MTNEKPSNQSEIVRSLASTIHKKMVAPSADRVDIIYKEIQQISRKLSSLEKELSQLDSYNRTTRYLACSLAAGAALLSLVLFYLVS